MQRDRSSSRLMWERVLWERVLWERVLWERACAPEVSIPFEGKIPLGGLAKLF